MKDAPTSNGYDIAGKKADYATVDAAINFPNDASWLTTHSGVKFPRDRFASKWEGLL